MPSMALRLQCLPKGMATSDAEDAIRRTLGVDKLGLWHLAGQGYKLNLPVEEAAKALQKGHIAVNGHWLGVKRFASKPRASPASTGSLRIQILCDRPRQLVVEFEPDDTINEVMAKIQRCEGIHKSQQRLFFGCVQLEELRTCADYNIQKDSTLQMVIRFGRCEEKLERFSEEALKILSEIRGRMQELENKFQGHLGDTEQKEKIVQSTTQQAEKNKFEGKQKLEDIANPIVMKEKIEKAVQDAIHRDATKIRWFGAPLEPPRCKGELAAEASATVCKELVDEMRMAREAYKEKLKEKFEEYCKEKIEKAVQVDFNWHDRNLLAEKNEFDGQQKELAGIVMRIDTPPGLTPRGAAKMKRTILGALQGTQMTRTSRPRGTSLRASWKCAPYSECWGARLSLKRLRKRRRRRIPRKRKKEPERVRRMEKKRSKRKSRRKGGEGIRGK